MVRLVVVGWKMRDTEVMGCQGLVVVGRGSQPPYSLVIIIIVIQMSQCQQLDTVQ